MSESQISAGWRYVRGASPCHTILKIGQDIYKRVDMESTDLQRLMSSGALRVYLVTVVKGIETALLCTAQRQLSAKDM